MPFNVKPEKRIGPPSYHDERLLAVIDAKAADLAAAMQFGNPRKMNFFVKELNSLVEAAKRRVLEKEDD